MALYETWIFFIRRLDLPTTITLLITWVFSDFNPWNTIDAYAMFLVLLLSPSMMDKLLVFFRIDGNTPYTYHPCISFEGTIKEENVLFLVGSPLLFVTISSLSHSELFHGKVMCVLINLSLTSIYFIHYFSFSFIYMGLRFMFPLWVFPLIIFLFL